MSLEFIMECDLVYKDLEGLCFQNGHIDDAHVDLLSKGVLQS
jgi:hypothetical protein